LPGKGLIGYATSKKIGGKPQRNRAKRRYQEAVRLSKDCIERRLDYVVVVSPAGANAAFHEAKLEVEGLLRKVNARWARDLES
jgi:ribonuclease P protein component